jgi:hypothetical protein
MLLYDPLRLFACKQLLAEALAVAELHSTSKLLPKILSMTAVGGVAAASSGVHLRASSCAGHHACSCTAGPAWRCLNFDASHLQNF